jgi:hypothetical protein
MLKRTVIMVGLIAAMSLWLWPSPAPRWAVVAFVVLLFLSGIVISVKRMRSERRLIDALWNALTGR